MKMMFLNIPQNPQENTCTKVSFVIKLRAEACIFIKRETLAQVFSSKFCGIFKTSYFMEYLRTTPFIIKTEWLLCGCYRPPSWNDQYSFNSIGNPLDQYSQHFKKFLLTGDFNAEDSESSLPQFLYEYHCHNAINEKSFFKILNNPTCTDLFITKRPVSFQNRMAVPTGLSNFHKMVITVLKKKYKNNPL